MGSKPITRRAGTNYGSAPVNQEVTVDAAGTTPAKFERMSPIKQTITDLVDSGDWSPNYVTVGGERNVTLDPGVTPTGIGPGPTSGGLSYSNYYSEYDPTAIMPLEDTGLNTDDAPKRDKVEAVGGDLLVQGAGDVSRTANQPVKVDVSTGDSFKPMDTKTSSSSNDGKFVGPRERRERMRAVRQAGRQRKRGMIKEARLTGGNVDASTGEFTAMDVAQARKQGKIQKAQDIKAEAERMAGSNVDSYKTKFRGSGPKTPKSVKSNNVSFANESAANSSAGAASRLAQNMKPVNINTKPKNAQTAEKLTDQDKYELARGGVGKKMAKSPIYKMNGFGSKTYK